MYIEVDNPSVRRAMLVAKHAEHPKATPIKVEVVDTKEQEIADLRMQLEAARMKAAEIATTEIVPISVTDIVRIVGAFYGVSYADMVSPRRENKLVTARHVAIWLAKKITARSYPQIGRFIGGRDHATVIHACRKIEYRRTVDEALAADLAQIEQKIADKYPAVKEKAA